MMYNPDFMREAVRLSRLGIDGRHGGPFGSVFTLKGKPVGRGHNMVISRKNPIWHGEIVAMEDACKTLDTHDLTGCEVYTNSEPCAMCMGAMYGAGIKAVYFACTIADAEKIGFADVEVYKELALPYQQRKIRCEHVSFPDALDVFREYARIPDKVAYFQKRE